MYRQPNTSSSGRFACSDKMTLAGSNGWCRFAAAQLANRRTAHQCQSDFVTRMASEELQPSTRCRASDAATPNAFLGFDLLSFHRREETT
jgi:hypothetical protein